MKEADIAAFGMWLLDKHGPLLLQILFALVPVLALCVVGYALHLLGRSLRGGKP